MFILRKHVLRAHQSAIRTGMPVLVMRLERLAQMELLEELVLVMRVEQGMELLEWRLCERVAFSQQQH